MWMWSRPTSLNFDVGIELLNTTVGETLDLLHWECPTIDIQVPLRGGRQVGPCGRTPARNNRNTNNDINENNSSNTSHTSISKYYSNNKSNSVISSNSNSSNGNSNIINTSVL